MPKSSHNTKEFLAKAEWRATSMLLRVPAKTENHAWHKAWRIVAKMFSGNDCLKVTIVKQIR